MRPEYYEAIRYRRWQDLESYARKRPEQGLANVVFELAETIGDKAERKTLRRILWILSQAGFEPGEQTPERKTELKARVPYTLPGALAGMPEQHGYTTFIAYAQRGGKVSSLMMHALERWGYCRAREAKGDARNIPTAVASTIKASANLTVEADPLWVVSRMASAVRAKKPNVPRDEPLKLPGLWKTIFERIEDVPHPTLKMKPAPQTPEQRGELLMNLEHIQQWRLSLPPEEEVWTPIHAIRWDTELSDDEREVAFIEALFEHKTELFRDEVMRELSQRVRDAAYILHTAGDERGAKMLAVAHEFELHRQESDFAHWIMGRTALDLNANLDKDDFDSEGGDVTWDSGD